MRSVALPTGWRERELGELGVLFRGRGGTRADEEPGGLPCIRYGDLYSHHDYIVRSFASAIAPRSVSSYTRLQAGDVVFAGSGETFEEIGKAAAYCDDSPAYAGADTVIFRPGPELLPEFAGYAVNSQSAITYKSRMGQGSSVIHIGVEHLSRLPLRLPPRIQQERIVDVLSTIDETIEHTEELIAKTEQLTLGLMHDLFTRGVTADGHLRKPHEAAPHLYKQSSLGWIPHEWDVQPVRSVFRRRVERGRPGLPVMAVTMTEGLVPRESVDRRVETRLSPEQHLLVAEGDIAYNMMRMWQGVLGRASYDCLVSPAYVVMTPTERLESRYAEGLLSLPESIAKFKKMSYGVVDDRLRLYASDLERIQFSFPIRLGEQELIASHRDRVRDQLSALKTELQKTRKLRSGILEDLIAGRTPVSLSSESLTSPTNV